ncbi:MAG: hypothetical protein WAW61_00200 [Methylococcaceae bacterium]
MLELLAQLTAPFALFFTNTDRIYWLYLLTAFTIAFFLFLVHKQDYAKSGVGIVAYVFPKDIILHRSSINDYLFFLYRFAVSGRLYRCVVFFGIFCGGAVERKTELAP